MGHSELMYDTCMYRRILRQGCFPLRRKGYGGQDGGQVEPDARPSTLRRTAEDGPKSYGGWRHGFLGELVAFNEVVVTRAARSGLMLAA